MNRVGMLSIVLAAAVTGACGGAESASSSPTGPSTTTTTTSSQPQPTPQPAACVPANLRVASIQGIVVTLRMERRERRDRIRGARRIRPRAARISSRRTRRTPATPGPRKAAGSSRVYRRSATASSAARRTRSITPSATREDAARRRSPDWTGQSVGRSVFAERLLSQRADSAHALDRTTVRPRFAVRGRKLGTGAAAQR